MKSTDKDRATLIAIAQIYCAGNHPHVDKNTDGLCPGCLAAIETTLQHTLQCPYNHAHNCQNCKTKCQTAHSGYAGKESAINETRSDIRSMMAYAAPRMIWRHPLMTLQYMLKKIYHKQK